MDEKARYVTVPKKAYQLRVIEANKEISQVRTGNDGVQTGGNPMQVLDLEIINAPPIPFKNPETGEMDVADINGMQTRRWATLTKKALPFTNELRKALGMEALGENQLEEDQAGTYVGKTGYAILEGKPRVVTDSDGQPIVNPHTGKPVTVPELKFVMWLAPA